MGSPPASPRVGQRNSGSNSFPPSGDDEQSREMAARRRRQERSLRSIEVSHGRRRTGLPLGNTRNLRDGQREGAASVKRGAMLRLDEFDELAAQAEKCGARTALDLAVWLKSRGHRTAHNRPWTHENLYRTRGRARREKKRRLGQLLRQSRRLLTLTESRPPRAWLGFEQRWRQRG
jgi:hypothetical protein